MNEAHIKRKMSRGQVYPIGGTADQQMYEDESNVSALQLQDYNTIEAKIRKSQERELFDKKQDSHAENIVPSDDGQEIEQLFGTHGRESKQNHKFTKSEV